MSNTDNRSPPAPRTVLVIKTDTLGDLVLFAPTLRCLIAAWPATRFTVLIRRAYRDLAPALAPGAEWLVTDLDPFGTGPEDAPAELARLRAAVTALAPDLVVAATSRHHWLEVALAAAAPAARRLALGAVDNDPFFGVQLKLRHGLNAAAVFTETVSTSEYDQDWQRNFCLADALLGRAVPRPRPTLAIDAAARQRAIALLAQYDLEPGRYVVCAAAGFANVRIKTWPAEKFGDALRQLRAKHHLPALLVGHEEEHAQLEAVRARAGGAGLWLGLAGELPLLAALIAESALYFGNDTGAMHLAAALDVPLVAVFGGGTWPRFLPAARRSVVIVQPLPCFGCGWDCVFGDAPCLGGITVDDATAALDFALAQRDADFSEVRRVEHLPASTREMMAAAAARYHALGAEHVVRQQKLEVKDAAILEKEAEIHTKEGEIAALKAVCDERERVIFSLDGNVRALQAEGATAHASQARLERTIAQLPPDSLRDAQALADKEVHIRNLESVILRRDGELAELRASLANRSAGHHDLEQAKHYGRLLAEKEAVLQSLKRTCAERAAVIQDLAAGATTPTAKLRRLWIGAREHLRATWGRRFDAWFFKKIVDDYWMQIGVLRHYPPRPLVWDARLPGPRLPDARLPQLGLVTPSFGQEKFIERTLRSVLDQAYPKLLYVVQDGASPDRSAEIVARYAARLRHWESAPDRGQADAIHRGFAQLAPALGPDDVMAWLNSDDLVAPGALRFVAEYLAAHPDVDVVYGHRIIIDDNDCDVGRWIMPRHNPTTLEWIDYVPQETLFWRKRAWDRAGGIDPSFHFALDWDLLARFQQAGCRVVRVPYFLGAFRVHAEQKTSHAIHTTGADEMRRIRTRFHGERQDDSASIDRHAREARFWGAITARLHGVGIRW